LPCGCRPGPENRDSEADSQLTQQKLKHGMLCHLSISPTPALIYRTQQQNVCECRGTRASAWCVPPPSTAWPAPQPSWRPPTRPTWGRAWGPWATCCYPSRSPTPERYTPPLLPWVQSLERGSILLHLALESCFSQHVLPQLQAVSLLEVLQLSALMFSQAYQMPAMSRVS